MRKESRRILSLLLATGLAVTSIGPVGMSGKGSEVQAAETGNIQEEISNITADITVVNGGDNSLISGITSSSYTIDGQSYYNYSKYDSISATASSDYANNIPDYAIDGDTGTRWESAWQSDPQYITIDFGNVYPLKDIAIFWENATARDYTVDVSSDGSTFFTAATVNSSYGQRTDNIKFSSEINVKAVRIYCTSRTSSQYGNSIYEMGFFGSSEEKEVISVLSNLRVEDYSQHTGKYLVYFSEAEVSSGYNVYIDNKDKVVKKLSSSGQYITAEELKSCGAGEHTMYIVNIGEDGEEAESISAEFNITGVSGTYTNIPQIYIYSEKSITKEYHKNADVSITIVDKDGGTNKDIYDTASNIKIRGNSTSDAPKKPWNIKLSSKQKVLGMPKGKKWCLLANSFDKSLIRNSLSYNMGLEIGVPYTSESYFVDIYLNGQYQGNYLITEPVEAGSGRVDIDAYEADNTDILLELGTRYEEDVDHFTTSVLYTTFDVNEPEKGDDLTDDEVNQKIERVRNYLNEFESALLRYNYDEILNYIDEDTFVNFYIVCEYFKNVDFNFSSTRFYIKDNKIYAGPLWDFDLTSGNCSSSYYPSYYTDGVSYKGYFCQGMNWYRELLKTPAFYNKVKARYKELQYTIQNMYKENSSAALSIDSLVNTYGQSFERNYLPIRRLGAGWSLTNDDGLSYAAQSGWTTWQQPIEFLRTWLKNRNEWLCSEWGVDIVNDYDAPVEVEINGYQISTTEEGFRTVYSVGDTEGVVAKAGMLYAIGDVAEDDMQVGASDTVYNFEATESGKLDASFSTLESSQSYAMTMKFAKTASFYESKMNVRAYAQLEDGSYVYGPVETFTVYNIANYLYQNLQMNNLEGHDYLFNNILSVVDSSYPSKDFSWNNSVVKPRDVKN